MFVWKRAALFFERLACTSRWTVWSTNGKHTDSFLQKTTLTNSFISCHVPPPSNNGNWRFRLGLLPGVDDCIFGEVLHPKNISGMFLEHILVELSKVFQSCPNSLVWCFQSSKETNTYIKHAYNIFCIYICTYLEPLGDLYLLKVNPWNPWNTLEPSKTAGAPFGF